MTLSEARKILGLGPDDDPRPFLVEFQEARERIAEMVRSAPNETLAIRYQQGLVDFDQALASVREHLEASGLVTPLRESDPGLVPVIELPAVEVPPIPEPEVIVPVVAIPPIELPVEEIPAEAPVLPTAEATPEPEPKAAEEKTESFIFPKAAVAMPAFLFPKSEPKPSDPVPPPPPKNFVPAKTEALEPAAVSAPKPKPRRSAAAIWLLGIFLMAVAAGLFYLRHQEELALKETERLVELEKHGADLIDKRRWPEASMVFSEMEQINPKSQVAAEGRRAIEAGIAEEQSQFIGYWTGQARASFEANRWDEAEAAAKQVLDKFPKEKEAADLLKEIAEARMIEADRTTLATAREELQQRKWDAAIASASKILNTRPNDEDAKTLLLDATVAKEKAAADLAKAKSLLGQAKARDQGQFDQKVLDWLREANALAPEDPDIKAELEKIAAYARTLKVPGDFATPAEALAQAHDQDRILIGAGTWEGPLIVNSSVDLQGAGPDTTIVQCPAQKGNAITFGPGAKGARVSGISFRHQSFDPGPERYSAALIRDVTIDLVDCRFYEGSGHGLAVIEGGHAIISRCRFSDNGWDGIAASGPGSLLEVRQSESLRNFGHGIESWDGAAIILTENRCENNSRNGIHADNGSGSVTLDKNQLIGNREFGLVLSSAGSGKISGNLARENLLGGFAIRAHAATVSFTGNEAHKNQGAGLILDLGLLPANYANNLSEGNAGQQVLSNADLTVREPSPDTLAAPPVVPPPGSKPVSKRR